MIHKGLIFRFPCYFYFYHYYYYYYYYYRGRDKEYFTSHRILVENGKGIGSKRKEFRSIPYSEIVMYSVETAGKLDYDTEVHVWCDSLYAKIDFSKSEVDIFEVYQLLNAKIAMAHRKKGSADYIDPTPPNMDKK
ncbi:MAG: hypothetical protein ACI90V_001006 [Bacillariaceae sp.]|jgi:hypothetical protein